MFFDHSQPKDFEFLSSGKDEAERNFGERHKPSDNKGKKKNGEWDMRTNLGRLGAAREKYEELKEKALKTHIDLSSQVRTDLVVEDKTTKSKDRVIVQS